METFKGRVSNIKRDVEVVEPDYTNEGYTRGSTTDVTRFVLAGRSMEFKSTRATYDALAEGDELIVAGKAGGEVFHVTAYKNLTKNLSSHSGKGSPILRIIGTAVIAIGILFAGFLFFIGNSAMALLSVLPFLAVGVMLLYFDHKQTTAIKAIENYK